MFRSRFVSLSCCCTFCLIKLKDMPRGFNSANREISQSQSLYPRRYPPQDQSARGFPKRSLLRNMPVFLVQTHCHRTKTHHRSINLVSIYINSIHLITIQSEPKRQYTTSSKHKIQHFAVSRLTYNPPNLTNLHITNLPNVKAIHSRFRTLGLTLASGVWGLFSLSWDSLSACGVLAFFAVFE